jgi:hypothetical protein
LARLTQLTCLHLSGCSLDNSLVRALAKGLGPRAKLRSLVLGYNPGFDGAEGSAQSIGSCLVRLSHLELLGCSGRKRAADAAIRAVLEPRIVQERMFYGGAAVSFGLNAE